MELIRPADVSNASLEGVVPRLRETKSPELFHVWTGIGRNRRYARCWWHLTLHIINVEKNVSRLLFHFFPLPYLYLHNLGLVRVEVVVGVFWSIVLHFGISLFVFIDFYFIFACLSICVVGVFLYGVCFNVCLFTYLFCCFISFLFSFCIYLLFMLCDCTLSILFSLFCLLLFKFWYRLFVFCFAFFVVYLFSF